MTARRTAAPRTNPTDGGTAAAHLLRHFGVGQPDRDQCMRFIHINPRQQLPATRLLLAFSARCRDAS